MTLRKKWSDSIKEAITTIKEFQTGVKVPLKTGIDHFDHKCLTGIMGGEIIVIGGLSGHGKSFFMQKIERNLFSLNPDRKIALLRFNLEMSVMKLFMRSLQHKTNLPMIDLLFSPPKDRDLFNEVFIFENKYEIEHVQTDVTPLQFEEEVRGFIEQNKDKDNIIVTIDHIALFKGRDKKEVIDDTMEACMRLRSEFPKVTFIILSQLNREIEKRTMPRELFPRMSDFFQSSSIQHGADLIVVIHNPHRLSLDCYGQVREIGNEHLRDFFHPGSRGAYSKLIVENCFYYHYLKERTPNMQGEPTVYGEFFKKPEQRIELPNENPFETNVKSDNPFA